MAPQVTQHDIEVLQSALFARMDGHGKSLEKIWSELKDIRKEKAESEEKLADRISAVSEKCSDRHSGTTAKVVGISSFISGVTTAIGFLFKWKTGNP